MTRFDQIAAESGDREVLTALQMGLSYAVGEFAASRARYGMYRELDPPRLVHRFTTEVLARCTGPQVYERSATATAQVVGFASWWDMWKATYCGRWWMRWRRWPVRYIERSDTATATVRVEADLAVLFPHAQALPEAMGRAYAVVLNPKIDNRGF